MSLDQTALDREWPRGHGTQDEIRAARFRDWSADPVNRCLGCGARIDQTAAGTHGDRDGCVPACTNCTDYENLGLAIETARGDRVIGYEGGLG